jgi:hypothetical protein
VLDRPLVTSWTETDARLRHLTFEGVDIARARNLVPERAGDALVRSEAGVLVADVSSPGRTGTLIGFDVGASNWPLKASFVLFVRNVVELARAQRESALFAPARTGDPVRVHVPLDVDSVQVEHSSGRTEPVPARAGLAVIPGPAAVGFLHVSWAGSRPGSTLVPVSLSSDAESRIEPRSLPHGMASAAVRKPPKALASLGWIFALLALGLVALDVFWITRRRRASAPASQTPRPPARTRTPRAA